MKLRWIDLGSVEPKLRSALWEYPSIWNIRTPTIISFYTNKPTIQVYSNKVKIWDNLIKDELSDNIDIIRTYRDCGGIGIYYNSSDVLLLMLYLPNELRFTQFTSPIAKILREKYNNLMCFCRSNDVYYVIDGKERKFVGCEMMLVNDIWSYSADISFKLDYSLLNRIFNKSNDKFKTKIEFNNDYKNILCGVNDFNKNITMKDILPILMEYYADYLELDLYKDNMTKEEKDIIYNYADELYTKEWIYDRIHPKYGYVGN